MSKIKRAALVTLSFFVLSGILGSFNLTASASFLSAYQVLKQDYSYVVDRIVAGGAAETEIEAFLIDLERDVSMRGSLTEANFNSLMYQAFEEVIQWRIHRNVFRALLESYGDEIEYTLENSELHPDLVPIRNAVMKSLLGEDEKPPVSGGGGVTSVPNSDINQEISAELNKSSAVIQVDVAAYPELVLPGSLLNEVSSKGKTLILNWAGSNMSLPPGAVNMARDDKLTISAKILSQAKETEAAQKAGTGLVLTGSIYEIKASTMETPEFVFSRPVDITLTYNYSEPAEVQNSLAMYYYNGHNLNWEKLTGEHALSARYIRISTTRTGQYALFAAAAAGDDMEREPVSSNFIDVKGHWAEQDINTMYEKSLVSGVTPFSFEPERSITRAEFAAIMLRAMGEQPGTYMTGRFYDVPADAWYFNPVNKGAELGIISGYSSTSFGPQEPITREQIAVIISRAMQIKNKGIGVSASEVPVRLNVFADQNNISMWARDGVAFAAANNIIKGRSAAEFVPHATATRAEATAMILRMYNQL